eukprot:6190777-Pyramimonas_sp.AAC.1
MAFLILFCTQETTRETQREITRDAIRESIMRDILRDSLVSGGHAAAMRGALGGHRAADARPRAAKSRP